MISYFRTSSSHAGGYLGRTAGLAAVLVTAIVLIAGCRNNHDPDSYPATVRVINGVDDSDSLAATVGGKTVFNNVGFGGDSGFYGVQPGAYDVDVHVFRPDHSSAGSPEAHLDIDNAQHYTAIAYGTPTTPAHLAVFDSPKMTDRERKAGEKSGKAMVRVFNAAGASGKVDLLINSIVAFKNISYGHHSEAIPLAALPYEWSVKPAGDSDQVYGNPITLQLKAGRDYVVVVMGNAIDENLQIKAYEE